MAMFLIAGSFRITGAQPDGDSIRFTPDDPAKWDLITGPNKVKRNASSPASSAAGSCHCVRPGGTVSISPGSDRLASGSDRRAQPRSR